MPEGRSSSAAQQLSSSAVEEPEQEQKKEEEEKRKHRDRESGKRKGKEKENKEKVPHVINRNHKKMCNSSRCTEFRVFILVKTRQPDQVSPLGAAHGEQLLVVYRVLDR